MDIWIVVIVVFVFYCAGLGIGMYVSWWVRSKSSYDGTIKVTRNEERILFSLELNDDPRILEHKDEVIFKVQKDEIPGVEPNRE